MLLVHIWYAALYPPLTEEVSVAVTLYMYSGGGRGYLVRISTELPAFLTKEFVVMTNKDSR